MVCYRRHGHNEGDEPAFTQPLMYEKIKNRISIRELYTEQLVMAGDLTEQRGRDDRRDVRRQAAGGARGGEARGRRAVGGPPGVRRAVGGPGPQFSFKPVETGVAYETLREIAEDRPGSRRVSRSIPSCVEMLAARVKTMEGKADARLGVRRDAGVRLAARRRTSGAAERPGQPPRHLQPAARGAGRPEDRRAVYAAQSSQGEPARVLRLRQPALRGGRARLRLRLLARRAQHADPVGGPVRRLRQRGPGDHRPVHRVGRVEVGARAAAWSCSCRTATRGRGRSIRAPGSSGSSSSAPRTTSRSRCRPRRRSTSTCCGARSAGPSASP